MSENKFEWTNDLVLEFVRFTMVGSPTFQGRHQDIDDFIESKTKKPFITEDGVELHEGCEIYGVAIQGTNNDTIWKRRFPFDRNKLHTNRKWFAVKENADKYILMNKPLVSLTDILSVWGIDNFKSPRYYMDAPIFVRIKELAKSKLK